MRPFSSAWWRQERRAVEQRPYLWPGVVVLGLYGLGGLAWCLYNGWWTGAGFTAAWTTALLVLFGPSRHGWQRRKEERTRQG
jgi:hypothetical protein